MKASRVSILFRAVLFVTKLRLTVRRFRKRRELTKEWIDIENSNEVYASTIFEALNRLSLNKYQIQVISVGLNSILSQSKAVREKLRSIIKTKGVIFGSAIQQICSSFQVYEEYLSKYLQKQRIISELGSEAYLENTQPIQSRSLFDLKLALNENTQKLVFRTYHISILLSGFIKCLSKKSQESQYFQIGIKIMLKLNKKYDRLLKKEKKEMELERIIKINKSFQGCCLLSSVKAEMNSGSVVLHIFQMSIGIEMKGDIQIVRIDRYCSIFVKVDHSQRLVCLITKPNIFHFFFNTIQDLNRFYKIVQSCIQGIATEISVTQSQLVSTFQPFIFAQLCDYRESIDLKNNKDTYIQVLFASIKRFQLNEQKLLIQSSMRQSMQWADLNDHQYNNQISESVTLTLDDLCQIKRTWQNQYQALSSFPKYYSFNGKVSIGSLKLLEWEAFLNTVLRSRIFINNPILLLKKLRVTDIFLETSEAQGRFQAQNGEQSHCRLCSRILVNDISRYLAIRLDFLRKKYQQKSKQYCFLIFQQIRKQICKISIYQLKQYYQLLIWLQFKKGTIDYSFRRIAEANKGYYVDVTILSIFEVNFQALINKHTLVSDVLDQIYLVNGISCLVGYRLVLHYSDKELILRSNEQILPILQYYNVKLDKLYKPSFFSTIGRLLQFSQKGILVLKPIILYPLCSEQLIAIEWQEQYIQYQFKSDRFVGLDKKDKIQITILMSIRQLLNLNKQLPAKLSLHRFNKFVPISLDEEADDLNDYIQQIYSRYLSKTLKEVKEMLDFKFSLSPFYKTYNFEVKILQASSDIEGEKKFNNLIFGIGWSGVVFSTLYQKILITKHWQQIQILLNSKGIRILSQKTYLIMKCPRVLQIYRILKDYQDITSMSNFIKQK